MNDHDSFLVVVDRARQYAKAEGWNLGESLPDPSTIGELIEQIALSRYLSHYVVQADTDLGSQFVEVGRQRITSVQSGIGEDESPQ